MLVEMNTTIAERSTACMPVIIENYGMKSQDVLTKCNQLPNIGNQLHKEVIPWMPIN